MAPLREFDLAVKAPEGAPPNLPATGAPTSSESGSTALPPSPPLPANPPGEAGAAAAAAVTASQEGVASAGGGPGAAGERNGGGGGGGESVEEERPGLVSLKGASFRWASGVEEDEHAKIFRGLVEVDEKKRKVKG